MPLTGDTAALRSISGSLRDLGTPASPAQNVISSGVGILVRERLVEQFAKGESPTGTLWQRTVGGKPALMSKKLPGDFQAYPVAGGVSFKGRIPWMSAHQEGHVFPARSAASRTAAKQALGNRFVKFNEVLKAARGKNVERIETNRGTLFVRQSRSKSTLLARAVVIREHRIGVRVLPKREIYPTGAMPGPWAEAINRGAQMGFDLWSESQGLK